MPGKVSIRLAVTLLAAAGIAGCTREKKSRNPFLKIGGDSASRWVRSCASIWPNVS